jgi:hypothetical protein
MLNRVRGALESTVTLPGCNEVIDARVPILTGRLITGLPVDISYAPEGQQALDVAEAGVAFMRRYRSMFPQVHPILLLFKAILKEQALNKVRPPACKAAETRPPTSCEARHVSGMWLVAHDPCVRLAAWPNRASARVSGR